MRLEPTPIIRILEASSIITAQNRSEWVAAAGGLTEFAKDMVEGMFLSLVLQTPERIRATPPGLLQKLERAVPHLVAVGSTLPQPFDLRPSVVAAVDALNGARARTLSFADWAAQGSLFGEQAPLDATELRLGTMLDELGPRQVGDAFRRWAAAAAHDPDQQLLIGRAPTPASAVAALFRHPNPAGAGRVRCARCGGSGRVSPWAATIDWCPVCSGEGWTAPPKPQREEQLRLVNPTQRRDSFVSVATTTSALARELVARYGGTGFPKRVEVLTAGKAKLILRFAERELTRATFRGKKDAQLLSALQKDLQRRHPLA
jgi:hypothetical protein